MKSRTDIALGKPVGLWFQPRQGNASLVRLTKPPVAPIVDGDEPTESNAADPVDPFAEQRAAAFD